jgi:RNA 3'-terminal phosphate cyclase (ATP)
LGGRCHHVDARTYHGDMLENPWVTLDGSRGEGGGQILRTALALSVVTQRPFSMEQIRAGRAKPGLRRQHLACVHAAARLCGAVVRGDELSSQRLQFEPGRALVPALDIDIGSAGSTALVLQTLLPPALLAAHPIRATIRGGTHNPMAPSLDFLRQVFVPALTQMGAQVEIGCERHGFMPAGGGVATLHVEPYPLGALHRSEAGPVVRRRATAVLARLPTHVADRELEVVRQELGFAPEECEVREVPAACPGNALLLYAERAGGGCELITGLGERGTRAELVARGACQELRAWLEAEAPVGEHLADQLLLPMVLGGGGQFRCSPLSSHTETNIETIAAFVPERRPVVRRDGATWLVEVPPPG